VIVGAVKVKLVAVCNGAGFELETTVVDELERKLNAGFAAGTALLERFRPAPNPMLDGLLTDEPVPLDD
jgi:hypothetical protein